MQIKPTFNPVSQGCLRFGHCDMRRDAEKGLLSPVKIVIRGGTVGFLLVLEPFSRLPEKRISVWSELIGMEILKIPLAWAAILSENRQNCAVFSSSSTYCSCFTL